MSNYLASDNVKAFPNAKRNTEESRVMCEERYTEFITKTTDFDGFVINPGWTTARTGTIEFYICGYLFKVDVAALIDKLEDTEPSESAPHDIYANINITAASASEFRELNGQDADDVYNGVSFSLDNAESGVTKSLKILSLSKDIGGWKVSTIQESFYKLSEKSLQFSIDGGEITLQ